MTKNLFVAITTSAALTATIPALASNAGNPAAGQKKSTVCVACHGTDGKSTNPMWPNLSSQNPAYLLKQLQDFKSGRRNDPSMAPIVKQLSQQDMADLAAYYASQGNNNMSSNQNPMSGPNSNMNWNQNQNQMSGWNNRGRYGNPNRNQMSGPNSNMNWNPNQNQRSGWNNRGGYGNPNMNQMSGPNSGMNWNRNQNQMSGPNSGMNWNRNQNPMSGWNNMGGYGNPNTNPMSGPNSGMNWNRNQNPMSGWNNMGGYGNPNMNPMFGPNSGRYGNPNMNQMSGPNSGMNWNQNPNQMSGPNSGMNWNQNPNQISGPNSGMNWNQNPNQMSGPNSGMSGNQNMNSMPSDYMSNNNLVMREGETFGIVMGDNPADTENGMWALIAMPNCLRLIDRFSKSLPSSGAGLPQEQVFVFQAQNSCRATIGFTRRSNQGVTARKSYHVLVH